MIWREGWLEIIGRPSDDASRKENRFVEPETTFDIRPHVVVSYFSLSCF
jgi:hypothetical protein